MNQVAQIKLEGVNLFTHQAYFSPLVEYKIVKSHSGLGLVDSMKQVLGDL